jgi:hypothetical protein
MGATLYIVVEGEDPGFDIFVNGRALARNEDALEKMAQRIGVKPLLEFFSADENSMALLLEEGAGDPEWAKTLPPPQWYARCSIISKHRQPRWEQRLRRFCGRWKSSSAFCARRRSARCAGSWPSAGNSLVVICQTNVMELDGCPRFALAYLGRKRYFSIAFSSTAQRLLMVLAERTVLKRLRGKPHHFPPRYAEANLGHPSITSTSSACPGAQEAAEEYQLAGVIAIVISG